MGCGRPGPSQSSRSVASMGASSDHPHPVTMPCWVRVGSILHNCALPLVPSALVRVWSCATEQEGLERTLGSGWGSGWGACWSSCRELVRVPDNLILLPLPCFRSEQVCVHVLHEQSVGFLQLHCPSRWFSNQLRGLAPPSWGAQYVACTARSTGRISEPM